MISSIVLTVHAIGLRNSDKQLTVHTWFSSVADDSDDILLAYAVTSNPREKDKLLEPSFAEQINRLAQTTTFSVHRRGILTYRPCLALGIADAGRVLQVLTACLREGVSLSIESMISVHITPADLLAGETLTVEKIEALFMRQITPTLQLPTAYENPLLWDSIFRSNTSRNPKAWFTEAPVKLLYELSGRNLLDCVNVDTEPTATATASTSVQRPQDVSLHKLAAADDECDSSPVEDTPHSSHPTSSPVNKDSNSVGDSAEEEEEEDDLPVWAHSPKRYKTTPPRSPPAYSGIAATGPLDDIQNEFVCMICMENTPDTIAKPCNCVCVCSVCSPQLRSTAYARKCLRCQRQINYLDTPQGDVKL